MSFNEDSRVKIPALLHLTRLGYTYIPRKEHHKRDEKTNIFPEIFKESIANINDGISESEINNLLDEIKLKLDYDDLGRDFYHLLSSGSGIKLFDFKELDKNSFHITTELTCKSDEEEFRPDITIFINGLPLAFIEVKKPNNKKGILAERDRMNVRCANGKFKRFMNITQLMIFSDNMEYEDGVIEPVQGAYYATSARSDMQFNYFREEENLNLTQLLALENPEIENRILNDNGKINIKYSDEFQINKHYNTPTHRIITSLLSKERLAFLLKYAIAYVEEETNGIKVLNKHIMRYPQFFATKAIEQKLDGGMEKGVIWHTQGSGKTALAYYNVRFLTDYYQKKKIIPKFYFIVDRIDLADQASIEFTNRGLIVKRVSSRSEFLEDMKTVSPFFNNQGKLEITVVNIQKFTEDSVATTTIDYDINIQRIYFLDEAHRSYNPRGNYLSNMVNSDKKAVKIALTGTPLLREIIKDYDTKTLFGPYIHKYYYNMSIADGYTRRLIREGIDTAYKIQMQEIIEQIRVMQGEISTKAIFAHPQFVNPMLDYILNDLQQFRHIEGDDSLGGMVVCDSSEQAKALFASFEKIYGKQEIGNGYEMIAAESDIPSYGGKKRLRAGLILHDVNDKHYRKEIIDDFKNGKIDILFVYNMLLTGFDSKRLKKLYLGRVVQDHNLLQTLTRVNRPYKHYMYGYVVDFADITNAFDRANYNYLKELQEVAGDEIELYSNLFKSEEEINQEIEEIEDILFRFNIGNSELFRLQIDEIKERKKLKELIKALRHAKELKNVIRFQGLDELLDKLDFFKLNQLLNVAQARLDKLNLFDALNNETDITHLLNEALEDVIFTFAKVSHSEMIMADQLRNQLKRTREAMVENFDIKDPAFVSLKDELERLFRKKNLEEISQEEMKENIRLLQEIYDAVTKLNRENNLLKAKYENDEKYVRVHKRLMEARTLTEKERKLYEALLSVKKVADDRLARDMNILKNEEFFKKEMMSYVINQFLDENHIKLNIQTTKQINNLIVNEYYSEYRGTRI
ncbi:MAG: DEAD/DEAH box helicase family protein [Prevotella sp.]|jgi:type I restriction enzyme R subunit|nr:DEAD/DEAH box helicase family protein [Prevotella sp.]